MQVVANGAHHDFPGVEANAVLYGQVMGAAHLLGIGAQRCLHGQGRITGPGGVILVGNGGAKEGHNAVAQHLVHGAFIAVHRVHHGMQSRVQKLLGGFRIKATDEFQRVFEIRKQHRDLLALAFQDSAGRADFLDQGHGSVCERGTLRHSHRRGQRRRWTWDSLHRWQGRQPMPTSWAERGGHGHRLSTGAADLHVRGTAGHAKPGRTTLGVLAHGTAPDVDSSWGAGIAGADATVPCWSGAGMARWRAAHRPIAIYQALWVVTCVHGR